MFYYYRILATEVHKVDGPHEGSISCPQSGWTPWGIKIHVHKVDEPHEG